MAFSENISLKPYNTFGIDVKARYFIEVNTQEKIEELLSIPEWEKERFLIIGEGSNLVFVNDFEGLIIKVSTKGIAITKETNEHIFIKAQAGENWDHLVEYCVQNNWGGLENMSLIPGCVGASPVQNVGAYGSEAKDVITQVEAIEIRTNRKTVFSNVECKFSYRDSVFKNVFKNQYMITAVEFRLNKNPQINLQYNALKQELEKMNVSEVRIQDVREAICLIRSEKLPSPDKIGSAGSFFKNPIVDKNTFDSIQKEYSNIVSYSDEKGIKLAAGWLIEQCGWKGKHIGQAGVHDKQALVLINWGNATGKDVLELSMAIQASVKEKFGVSLEPEANIVL